MPLTKAEMPAEKRNSEPQDPPRQNTAELLFSAGALRGTKQFAAFFTLLERKWINKFSYCCFLKKRSYSALMSVMSAAYLRPAGSKK